MSCAGFLQQIQSETPRWLSNREQTAHVCCHCRPYCDTIKSNGCRKPIEHSKQYLRSIGQYPQEVMSPIGIDRDYHVDEHTSTKTQDTDHISTDTTLKSNSNVLTNSSIANHVRTETQTSSYQSILSELGLHVNMITIEQKITNCMENMKAMGFNQMNDTLLTLIRSKQGEINAVLDAIDLSHYTT
jgi:hypothetical protein